MRELLCFVPLCFNFEGGKTPTYKFLSAGNYHEAKSDAEAARQFQPNYMKAIETGNEQFCFQLRTQEGRRRTLGTRFVRSLCVTSRVLVN